MTFANGWTGGQYSLFRVIFAMYLFVHFFQLAPWGAELFSNQGMLPDGAASPLLHLFPNVLVVSDAPATVTALLVLAAALCVPFGLGWHDRAAALGLWYCWACLFGRNPLINNPGLPYVGWMLLAHACLPAAPYGSLAARGRADPGGGWSFPAALFGGAWTVMALGYSYSGYTKLVSPSWRDGTALARVLDNPLARPGLLNDMLRTLPETLLQAGTWTALALELCFAPLVLWRPLRPWLWSLLLVMHLTLIAVLDFADLSLGMVMLHLFTFDPAWVRPLGTATDRLYYDGQCGLCHGAVRLILAEDRGGHAFTFAPLDSDTFRSAVPEVVRTQLPDSLVVEAADGGLLVRSRAVIHIARRLGGVWRLLGELGRWLPPPLFDRAYDGVASVRRRLFRPPSATCPLLPPELRKRFSI